MSGSSSFFDSKAAAAILKHAVLDQYVDPFAMKTGSTSSERRVAFVDGYAGEGRYADAGEGSPALLIRKAHALAPKRQMECMFIEHDPEAFKRLCEVVSNEAGGLSIVTLQGDVAQHLDIVIARTHGIPLFVFLDPFGLMIPFDDVVKIFERPRGLGAPATEVLINFTAVGLRRIAGHLFSEHKSEATLQRMDEVCGGTWWRDAWSSSAASKEASDAEKQDAEDAVVTGYAQRMGKAAHAGWWTFDVRNRPELRPAYHLVFLSRHRDGLALFGESLSLGLVRWRRAVFDEETSGTLFSGDGSFKAQEGQLEAAWIAEIARNLRVCLAQHGAFTIVEHYDDVFGATVGRARQTHLRAAWKQLHDQGLTKTDSKGKSLIQKRIEPA